MPRKHRRYRNRWWPLMAANPLAQCRLTPAMFAELNEAAAAAGVDRSEYMRRLVADGLAARRDYTPDYTQAPCNHAVISNSANDAASSGSGLSSFSAFSERDGKTSPDSFPPSGLEGGDLSAEARDPGTGPLALAQMAETKASVATLAASQLLRGANAPKPRPDSRAAILLQLVETNSRGLLSWGDSRTWEDRYAPRGGSEKHSSVFGAAGKRVAVFKKDEEWRDLGVYLGEFVRPTPPPTPLELVGHRDFAKTMQKARDFAGHLATIGGSLLHMPRIAAAELDRLGGPVRLSILPDALGSLSRANREAILNWCLGNREESRWRLLAEWLAAGHGEYWGSSLSAVHIADAGRRWLASAATWDQHGRPSRRANRNAPVAGPATPAEYARDDEEDNATFARRYLARGGI